MQGRWNIYFERGLETSARSLQGTEIGLGVEPLKSFVTNPLNCKRATYWTIKIHSILDRIGYLSNGIIQWQGNGGGGGAAVPNLPAPA